MGEEGLDDPHPLFEQMRKKCPVARSEAMGGYWLMSRYEDCLEALKTPTVFSNTVMTLGQVEEVRGKLLPLNYDPPEHTVFRTEMAPWFSPTVVKRTEPGARDRLRRYLATYAAAGGGEFISAVAEPFPCVTFLLILGLPLEDMKDLLEWKDMLIHVLLKDDQEKIDEVVDEGIPLIGAYFNRALDERAAMEDQPDDVLTSILHAKRGDVPFTRDEMVQTLMLFFQAGLDTVTGTLGFIMEFLATHPEHRQLLIEEPTLIPNAVEELVRYFSIVTVTRKVMETVAVAGVTIPKGDFCVIPTASAGRDELQYENASDVDFRRRPIRHLGFGGGPHRCIGSHLARMELIVALEEIFSIMPDFELDPAQEVGIHWGAVAGIDKLHLLVK